MDGRKPSRSLGVVRLKPEYLAAIAIVLDNPAFQHGRGDHRDNIKIQLPEQTGAGEAERGEVDITEVKKNSTAAVSLWMMGRVPASL